jgi:protein-S-isoprenylcysteine O-methyltransferase Ste14
MKLLSILGLLLMVAGLCGLLLTNSLFSLNPVVIAVQAAAVILMVWARITFGMRSFHASANPTEGGLVTTGPYAFIRHPIYTAVCLFIFAGGLAHLSWMNAIFPFITLMGSLIRMLIEERLVVRKYPEYAAYSARTKRMIPYII